MRTLTTTIAITFFLIVNNCSGQSADNNFSGINSIQQEVSFRNHETNYEGNKTASSVKVSPMQIAEGIITVKLFNQPKGTYTVRLLDEAGVVLSNKDIDHMAGTSSEIVQFGKTLE